MIKMTNQQELKTDYERLMDLCRSNNFAAAKVFCQTLLKKHAQHPLFHNTLGNILLLEDKVEEAINHYQTALAIQPDYGGCLYNLATAYRKQRCFTKALSFYKKALELQPDHLGALHYSAVLYAKTDEYGTAIEYFRKALALDPENINYLNDIAGCYKKLKDYKNALLTYEALLQKQPKNSEFLDGLVSINREICAWDQQIEWTHRLLELQKECQAENKMFALANVLLLDIPIAKKFTIAKMLAQGEAEKNKSDVEKMQFIFKHEDKKRLRIGYVCADLRNHPVAHLMKNMFAYHNRKRFEIFLYSIGPEDGTIYRRHIANLSDHFLDAYTYSVSRLAERIYQDNIDILIDTTGYMEFNRCGVFILKPAPIQMLFLAYPGTTGSAKMDYLIVDKISVPPADAAYYSEKPLYMPYTYFVTDDKQPIASRKYQRKDFHLPEDAFIFCSFNRLEKLDVKAFDVWMRILKQVPNSVLWLAANPEAKPNLIEEAKKRGVSEERLIFTFKSLEKDQHLARLKLVDFFLDCFIYTAHTTAIDALWVGKPIVTLLGDNMASRATGSILHAMNLSELITETEKQFEETILHYALNPAALQSLYEKIVQNRNTASLFNTSLFVKHLEQGFEKAWQLYLNKEDARAIEVNIPSPLGEKVVDRPDEGA